MPALSQSAEIICGIYIARGDDTLGPYNSLEAAALVVGGYLRLDDYAARSGDASWCALADFLPLSAVGRPVESMPPPAPAGLPGKTHPHRWRRLAAAFAVLLATPLLVAGGVHWFRHPQAVVAPPQAVPLLGVAPSPTSEVVLPIIPEPAPPVADGPLTGSLPAGAGVRVSAYPLAALEPALGQETADAQAARARLDPQIEAAAGERAVRATESEAALKALRAADPADPMLASLRFASQGAKAAAKTAEDDYRYLVDERDASAGGEVYFHGLPAPEIAAETDAQGRFTLPLPPGTEPYAVAASARRTMDDGTVRSRYWLVKLSPAQRAGHETVRLDDGNASFSPAAESLIHTAD